MKTLFAGLIVLVTCVLCFAQSDTQKEPDWQPFAPDREEFSTEVPVQLRAAVTLTPSANRNYKGRLNGTYFFIFSDRIAAPGATKIGLAFGHAAQPGTSEMFGDMPSEKFEFADDEGFFHRLFTFKTKTRIYVLQTVSSEKDDPLAERFFAKLQIGKIQPADGETQPIEPAAVGVPAQPSGGGIAAGKGSGIGSGQPSQVTNQQPQTTLTSPLNILSKPRPLYTDLARFYGIQGTVRTKVVFLHDGTIGTVTPVTKLPFGLTKSAISAAKSIQFSPAVHDGKTIDITKQVEYSFSIY